MHLLRARGAGSWRVRPLLRVLQAPEPLRRFALDHAWQRAVRVPTGPAPRVLCQQEEVVVPARGPQARGGAGPEGSVRSVLLRDPQALGVQPVVAVQVAARTPVLWSLR